MYKVLIVDDEQAIREGLTAVLNWESLGFKVAGTAANAIEAKHKYELYCPDLMIVDIRMPGRDGLELIQELRVQDPELNIIILSGYADFSYAKRAMSFGIDNYLLKPVDEDELERYLTKLAAELNSRVVNREKDAAVKVWSREMLVQSLLMESGLQSPQPLKTSLTEAGLLWESYQVVLIRLLLQNNADNGPSTAVKSSLAACFEEHGWGIVFSLDSYLGVLLQPSFQKELVRKLMVEAITEAVSAQGLECIITAGDMVDSAEQLSRSRESALARMRDYFFYDETGIIGPDSLRLREGLPVQPGETPQRLEDLADRLYFAIDVGSSELLPSLIQQTGELMISAGFSEMAVKSHYVRLLTSLINKLALHHGELGRQHSRMDEHIQPVYKHTSLPRLQRYITVLLEQYAGRIALDDREVLMKRMLDLIHRHYSENLKLDTLADVFTYSSAYLGKLFKNNTGYSFNSYLDKVRIEKSKELLDQGCKIHLAANKVGYSDVDYFREKFKKIEGISPSAYRRSSSS